MTLRLGALASAPAGICIERSCKGKIHRYSLRAWTPHENIPAQHFTREELAGFLVLRIPEKQPRKKPRSFPKARGKA